MQSIQKDCPSRLEYFNKDVVVYITHKVGHFMVSQVESVEFGLQIGTQTPELLLI